MKTINDLPDKCLERIFSLLQPFDLLNIEKVCQRWCSISERVWKKIRYMRLGGWYSQDINETRLCLERCGHYVKVLDLKINENYMEWLPMAIELLQPDQLEEIRIHFWEVYPPMQDLICYDDLIGLFSKTNNVTELAVEVQKLDHLSFLNIMPPEKLRSLMINRPWVCRNVLNSPISYDILRFPNLEELNCENMVVGLEEKRYGAAVFKWKIIRLFACIICRSFYEKFQFFTELEELHLLYNSSDIDEEYIRDIRKNCTKLKVLKIDDKITAFFPEIGKMPSLEFLHLHLYKSFNMCEMPLITNVKEWTIVEDVGFVLDNRDYLVECILHSQNLRKLNIRGTSFWNHGWPLLADVTKMFNCGQRTIPLRIEIAKNHDSGNHPMFTVINYPLLTLAFRD